jgi:hypothetical protein
VPFYELSVEQIALGSATVSSTENTSAVAGVTLDASEAIATPAPVATGATVSTAIVTGVVQDAVESIATTTTTTMDMTDGGTTTAGMATAAMEMNTTNNTGSNTQAPRELQRNRIEQLMLERCGVTLDPFYLLHAYQKTLKRKHVVYDMFSGLMRNVLFMICPEDLEKEEKSLTEIVLKDPKSKVLDYCHQHIPNPSILLPLLQKRDELCADVKDATFR